MGTYQDEGSRGVITQVFANSSILNNDIHAGFLQDSRLADARELQNLWTVDGTSADDDLSFHLDTVSFPFDNELYPSCFCVTTILLHLHFRYQRVSQQRQI